jgi:hypothetical protein
MTTTPGTHVSRETIERIRAIVRDEVAKELRERGYIVPEKGRAYRPEDAPKDPVVDLVVGTGWDELRRIAPGEDVP